MPNQPLESRIAELLEKASELPWPERNSMPAYTQSARDWKLTRIAVNAFPTAVALAQKQVDICNQYHDDEYGTMTHSKSCRLAREFLAEIEENLK